LAWERERFHGEAALLSSDSSFLQVCYGRGIGERKQNRNLQLRRTTNRGAEGIRYRKKEDIASIMYVINEVQR
jgi:hypothetical protein